MSAETPRPTIYHYCERCDVKSHDVFYNRVVVSPAGTAHFGVLDYGKTQCGFDATGDGWWWPLWSRRR